MNLMNNNMVQRGLTEYKVSLLSLLGRIMGRGKGCISRGNVTVKTMGSQDYINQKMVERVIRSQPGK